MIAMNLSHETFVHNPGYLNMPGVEYETIEYDNYEFVKLGKGDKLSKVINEKEPIKTCVFAQPKRDSEGHIIDSQRGVVPRILQHLLAERKATKKRMAKESDPFKAGLLNAMQAAFKVTANSVYGQMGTIVLRVLLSLNQALIACAFQEQRHLQCLSRKSQHPRRR